MSPSTHVGGIDVETEVALGVPPAQAFDAMTRIGEWWPHRLREGSRVVLEPWVGGRWFEDWEHGNGALYAVVTCIAEPELLILRGQVGLAGPVDNVVEFRLADGPDGGSVLHARHRGIGRIDAETGAGYIGGWEAAYARLREFAVAAPTPRRQWE